MVEIDTDLYSRQIGTFGMEVMGKLIKMNVLIIGQRGLGVEAAKNLILAGPKSVTLYDPTPVQWGDLSSTFYVKESDVGKTPRSKATISKLQELNPYVSVNQIDSLSEADLANYHLVLCTEVLTNIDEVSSFNKFCRAKNIGFILTQNLGAYGYAFLDYGNKFMVNDADGEETKSFIVTSVNKEKDHAVVTVHEDKRHKFQDGDFVKFREVEGMTQINDIEPVKITVIDGFSFKIHQDCNAFDDYKMQGLVENIKMPQEIAFHSFEESVKNPVASSPDGMLMCPDFRLFGRSDQLHLALRVTWEFQKTHQRMPNASDWDACKEILASINVGDTKQEEIDEAAIKKAISYSAHSISPLSAFFGGIVAQEIVKFTGKYMPLRQWLHYDIFETVSNDEKDRAPRDSRYDDQAAIFGWDVQEKLNKVKTFMVGAGALGCEYVKAFALMGLGCHEEGFVSVTDNDNIEVSNLNRQFLFRKNNVGHSKSEVACQIAKDMNNAMTVKDYQTRVGTDTEEVFNDEFWGKLDFVVNAVDNIHARLYVDGRCVWYKKPLLESGTLGTKANSQMIVPHITQCYGDSQDPPEDAIPMCTLRNFPNQIEHCIEWGRDLFNRFFVDHPSDAASYLERPKVFVGQLKANTTVSGQRASLEAVKKMIDLKRTASY
jgi:ubiquitin-activating enzyme E1